MKIVADRDIFRVTDYFSGHGELLLLDGRDIASRHLADADALLVRTVTPVTSELLASSPVSFIASATSGIDHVDLPYLARSGIHFSSAPGCNADAVVNYVYAALAKAAITGRKRWRESSIGIVGAGNVGGRLASKSLELGLDVAIFDPFLDESHALAANFASFERVLEQDIVSIHTPLTSTGEQPTFHLFDEDVLAGLADETVLINAARGAVINNQALLKVLGKGKQLTLVLDAWENEPEISETLASKVLIGTPHIAGYSLNGKLNATRTIYQQFCRFFSLSADHRDSISDKLSVNVSELEGEGDVMDRIILKAYAIEQDCIPVSKPGSPFQSGKLFDQLRNSYTFRPEFSDYVLHNCPQLPGRDLETLGFVID